MLTAAELGAYIDRHRSRSAFRLELLDRYDVETDGTDFERFMHGEPEPTPARKQPWLDRLRDMTQAGIIAQRVHVLSTPLTGYLRYECEWGYAYNTQAGEDIRILDLAERPAPDGLPGHDFWLIDDVHAIRMYYDNSGRYAGAEPVPADKLLPYQQARDDALAAAEPFPAWWRRHPEEHREHQAA